MNLHKGRIFLLDNQDSFAYNLVDELAQLGFSLEVYRNQLSADEIFRHMEKAALNEPVMLCLSPGPGHPSAAGCLLDLLQLCRGRFPVLGICLGFQAMVHQAGGEVGRSRQVMHGKTSLMQLSEHPVFAGLGSPLQIARYHSLQAVKVPESLTVIAQVDDIPMAAYDQINACIGYQFHPESIMTTQGSSLLHATANFLLTQAERLTCNN
ncbi:anthranilate synthase component II [Aliidiomarina soli]|uniref:anthranilate synthase n=1 Tax=Aliidiomarina soli TaxID=1928574 RepID=A0A432WH78_9GAMM|nr:gamma-glutamyl-gamma-aminobutyrate hydrolase family protein [Aliidiomarina soli]RUO33067.1 anthranilate synthase component II [Aliidiomarina soli]